MGGLGSEGEQKLDFHIFQEKRGAGSYSILSVL